MKNRLYKKIKSMLINQFGDLEKAETEINKYGIRGEIKGFIGWGEIGAFYKKYKKEIQAYYAELFKETGLTFKEYFGKEWDDGASIFNPADGNESILALGAFAAYCGEIFEEKAIK